MKITKVCFEQILNDERSKIYKSTEKYFETWKKSTSIRPFGSWLRREKPREFKRRYDAIQKRN